MNRQNKQELVSSLRESFLNSQAAFLVSVQGLSVAQLESFRKDLRQEEGKLRVAKNTLLKIATSDIAGADGLHSHFSKQIAVIFAEGEAPGVAKVIQKTAKRNEELQVIAGCFEGKVLDTAQVNVLASIPSREVLLAQVGMGIQSPTRSIAMGLKQVITQLAMGIKQVAEQNKVS